MSAPKADLPSRGFHTTRWSLVLATAGSRGPAATRALHELCELYWYPLYAFLRRGGAQESDALELVQGFVAELLSGGGLDARPERGRFRGYLLGALQHFASNAARKERAEMRGGGRAILSLDADEAEARYAREPAHAETPAALFERRWAIGVLEQALARLEAEYERAGRLRFYRALEYTLTGAAADVGYAEKARELDVSVSGVKVCVHRMRARLRELVRDEILQTVESAEEVDEELAALFAALAGKSPPGM